MEILKSDSLFYPHRLKERLGISAPDLYCLGNIDILTNENIECVGVAGSRKTNQHNLQITKSLCRRLVNNGYAIVSGYAAGVDTVAHLTALEHNSPTVIVLAEGIDRFKIKQNYTQYWNWDNVVVVSQYPPNIVWSGSNAMKRNKTIIALSKVMLIPESGTTGGTWDAGNSSIKMKVPLYVLHNECVGNTQLIRSGGIAIDSSFKVIKNET